MAHIATPGFLSSLKHLYPLQPTDSYVQSPWYAVAAITFSASNCPEAVPLVLEYVLRDLDAIDASHQDQLTAVRKIRDAVFKSGLICGFPKVTIAPSHVPPCSTRCHLGHQRTHPASPSDPTGTSGQGNAAVSDVQLVGFRFAYKPLLRNPDPTVDELTQAGKQYFDQTYGETAKTTQDLLSAIYPDLGASLRHVVHATPSIRTRLLYHQLRVWVRVRVHGRDVANGNVVCDDLCADRYRHASTDRMALGRCDQEWCDEGGSESRSGHRDAHRQRGGRRVEA